MDVRLTDCIGPAFYQIHKDIKAEKHSYYNLTGGRGSLKSSFISIEIVLGIMQDSEANAIAYRKVGDTIQTSVFEQICWAIEKLGVQEQWKCIKSPARCTYLPTGQVIIFKGLDKPGKSKSIKLRKGYFKYLWFEELDEYSSDAEIRSVQQSVLRGGDKFIIFKSMNPPKSRANWANNYIEENRGRDDTLTSHTTYLQAPEDWLGQPFIDEAQFLEEINPKAYEHEYLGIPIGNGTEVFDNLESTRITNDMIDNWEWIYSGIDWGWYPDPYHFGKQYYDSRNRELWIFAEYRCNRTTNEDTANHLIEAGLLRKQIDVVTCDSAEPKSVADYRAYGINARGAEKGPDSVRYGMKWLQSLNKIHIDPRRCPKTWEEFSHYEYELNKDGEPTSNYPDCNNHSIDECRYAMEKVWKRKGK